MIEHLSLHDEPQCPARILSKALTRLKAEALSFLHSLFVLHAVHLHKVSMKKVTVSERAISSPIYARIAHVLEFVSNRVAVSDHMTVSIHCADCGCVPLWRH